MTTGHHLITLITPWLSPGVAIVVPGLAFRFAIRQEQTRWLREQRSQLYIDLLTEAHAENRQLEIEIADEAEQGLMRTHYVDLRLPPAERARLASRCNILGSRKVNRRFMAIEGLALQTTMVSRPRHEGDRVTVRVRMATLLEDLEKAIRHDLDADRVSLTSWRPLRRWRERRNKVR